MWLCCRRGRKIKLLFCAFIPLFHSVFYISVLYSLCLCMCARWRTDVMFGGSIKASIHSWLVVPLIQRIHLSEFITFLHVERKRIEWKRKDKQRKMRELSWVLLRIISNTTIVTNLSTYIQYCLDMNCTKCRIPLAVVANDLINMAVNFRCHECTMHDHCEAMHHLPIPLSRCCNCRCSNLKSTKKTNWMSKCDWHRHPFDALANWVGGWCVCVGAGVHTMTETIKVNF